MKQKYSLFGLAFAFTFVAATHAVSAEPFIKDAQAIPSKNTQAAYSPSNNLSSGTGGGDPDTLIFTSPPRETPEESQKIYGPIADYLSKVIGKKIVYRHSGTWGAYRSEMLKQRYDLVFDGPHFNSYRAEKLNHRILVKLPNRREFGVVVRKDTKFTAVSQMGGRTFCAHAPPNLGALLLLSQFDNPARQPAILPTESWEKIFDGVVSGHCMGGVLPVALLKKFDKNEALKLIFTTPALPDQAFSAGPRISMEDQAKISAALLAPEAAKPVEKLLAAYKGGDRLVAANNAEYNGLSVYLRSEWGYY